MKTVIMAGGKGTRIASIASDIPKPMICIAGKPVLEHELLCLKKQGFDDIIITVSHLSKAIIDYFGDGSSFGIHIDYFFEEEPLGNAGALFLLKDKLNEDFLLLNGDVLFDIDFNRFVAYHKACGGLATLFTHPNAHPYDSGLIIVDQQNHVKEWLTKDDERNFFYKNRVNAGIHILSPKLLNRMPDTKQVDLDRHLLKPMAGSGQLYIYESSEYVRDMGTPERYYAICQDFLLGRVQARNLQNKQKAVFLDRDGTLNEYVGFVTRPEQLKLLPGVEEAIGKINNSGYLAIVVSNQPIIARGECTLEELDNINNKLETLLGYKGAYIDDIFFCPHHPDCGFIGERPEYKVICDCRKPQPGLLIQAAQKYNINLSQSYMVGDSYRDVEAGLAAGCHVGYIGERDEVGYHLECVKRYDDLKDFVLKNF